MSKAKPGVSSDDRWSICILMDLFSKIDFNEVLKLLVEKNWIDDVVKSVKEIAPLQEWDGIEKDKIENTIFEGFNSAVGAMMHDYTALKSHLGYRQMMDTGSRPRGKHQIYFSILSKIVRSGLLGNKEKAKKVLMNKEIIFYDYQIHKTTVDALFTL